MKRHLEYRDAQSNKFWEIEVTGNSHRVRFGKIGAKGQIKLKSFASNEAAIAAAEKIIGEKLREGYVDAGDEPPAAKAAPSPPSRSSSAEDATDASDASEATSLRGGLFVKRTEHVTPNDLVAKLREDGKLSKIDPKTPRGWRAKEDGTCVVGVAVNPEADGWIAIVDSADGAQGIGPGDFSRPAMLANHLHTDAVWFRIYDAETALAVYFHLGSQAFKTFAGDEPSVLAWLAARGLPIASARPPSTASKGATTFSIAYDEKKYRNGPDADLARELVAARRDLASGDASAMEKRAAKMTNEGRAVALGLLREIDDRRGIDGIVACARSIVRAPMKPRTEVKEQTFEEEIVRLAAGHVAGVDDTLFAACIARLDEIEAEASRRSNWAGANGLWRLAAELQTAGKHAAAYACYARIVLRDDAPHWGITNAVIGTLLLSRTGKIALVGDVAAVLERVEKRLPALGEDAQDAIFYNLACLYARAGDKSRALDRLKRCKSIRKQNPNPDRDADLESLWKDPAFLALVSPKKRNPTNTAAVTVGELSLGDAAAKALTANNASTVADILRLPATLIPTRERKEISERLRAMFGLSWGEASSEDDDEGDEYVPPKTRAVPRLKIDFKPGKQDALESRVGGLPNAPRKDAAWPESDSRPMNFILQLVGKKAGGEVDMGDLHVIQVFADLEGDFYDPRWHAVVMHREPCKVVLDAPTGVAITKARKMIFTPGADDRALLDVTDPDDEAELEKHGITADDHEAAHEHAWCDKVRGVPVGANLDHRNVKDSKGKPMEMLLELTTYDDWFLWTLWISADGNEAKMEIVRG